MAEHRTSTVERHCDVAVLGGSAAGLAAAIQLGRQRRAVIVVDAGDPRNAPSAHLHSYLGFDGRRPSELLAVGREEVRSYGGEVLSGTATTVERIDGGHLRVHVTGGHSIVARRVLLATGVADELPDIEGLAQHWGEAAIHCPFCHGYEVRDQRVVQVVTHPRGLHPAPLLRQLTDRLTVVLHDPEGIDPGALDRLRTAGVSVAEQPVQRIVTDADGRLTAVELLDGERLPADAIVVGPRMRARVQPVDALGVRAEPHPSGLGDAVAVDATGATEVPGVYAAGNVSDPGQQLLQAAADGSRVGALISFSLAEEDLAAAAHPSANEADWDHRYGGDRIWSGNPNGTLVAEATDLLPGRALDVGAGEGGDALWLAERGWTVTASDISRHALGHVGAEAERRGLPVDLLHRDANAPRAFEPGRYDLVSAQYASIPRTPDSRGVRNLVDAVAPGGTLLVVSHDLEPMRTPVDVTTQTRAFDPDAYVRVDDVAVALAGDPEWEVVVHERRPRPAGAASGHHVDDLVLRAVRRAA